MKVYPTEYARADYIQIQIDRSHKKFKFCKVSARDPLKYLGILKRFHRDGPILCLGTRNGREVDLFRVAAREPLLAKAIAATELPSRGFISPVDFLMWGGRSDWQEITGRSVIGVEINPEAARPDVWIGSFDEMPAAWSNRFGIVYSNSFDQAQDPKRTATEWLRVTKPGGFVIIAFGIHKEPSAHDPVGDLVLADILKLFPGELVYFTAQGTLYAEAIIRKSK